MNQKSKLRWYQFSLKIMLMAVAVVALPCCRVGYLLKMAERHETCVEKIAAELARTQSTERVSVREGLSSSKMSLVFARQRISEVASERGSVFKEIGNRKSGRCLHIGSEVVPLNYDHGDPQELWLGAIHETRLAMTYRKAVWKPWLIVNEPPRPQVEYVLISGPFSGRVDFLPIGDY